MDANTVTLLLSNREAMFLDHLRSIENGTIRVSVEDGEPTEIVEIRKTIIAEEND